MQASKQREPTSVVDLIPQFAEPRWRCIARRDFSVQALGRHQDLLLLWCVPCPVPRLQAWTSTKTRQ